ncbi:hypothetical protein BV898_00439 [Hypsibius exemplaris]|uniref:Uncharacterized protein n=1 Tax=Hypsibius exemplaris TaxID=2072580 RepID=A0A1W0XDM0_HYPEX|nr:hypothetical protein BV898_00439 [Hypsibius exemplaris]
MSGRLTIDFPAEEKAPEHRARVAVIPKQSARAHRLIRRRFPLIISGLLQLSNGHGVPHCCRRLRTCHLASHLALITLTSLLLLTGLYRLLAAACLPTVRSCTRIHVDTAVVAILLELGLALATIITGIVKMSKSSGSAGEAPTSGDPQLRHFPKCGVGWYPTATQQLPNRYPTGSSVLVETDA